MADAETRRDLALACRILAANGHGDNIYGHLSARADAPGRLWMKGHHIGLEEVAKDDLLLIDLDGKVLEGQRPRHTEYPMNCVRPPSFT